MKPLTKLLPIVFLLMINCVAQKTTVTYDEVVYEAITRGRFKNITVVNSEVKYKSSDEEKKTVISSEEVKQLNDAVSKLKLEEIKNLKAPTNKRMYDGSMHAVVKIKIGEDQYVSSTFDDGHPPKELQELVNVLMDFIEK
ncbi:hypothetical protein [Tenacibaculum sp. IB213877]|uniref:hypothetical protein n=1 Tax=Tenacibaculum sp. IB213877 TaxID=3097351 RepID=UPI002A5B0EFE|nr:hypothetical protein [Tenacibaculum sp. IB213877]MDY0781227.1 hypothetical protein [Tenacibaculum sp. IB213877]